MGHNVWPLFDWSKMASAAAVPVVIVSACALLCLALYNRLAAVVARLRGFQRERIEAATALARLRAHPQPTPEETLRWQTVLTNLAGQIEAVTARAHLVQRAIAFLLSAICTLMVSSLCSGLGAIYQPMTFGAAVFFLTGVTFMLTGVLHALRELRTALDPARLETMVIDEFEEALSLGLDTRGG